MYCVGARDGGPEAVTFLESLLPAYAPSEAVIITQAISRCAPDDAILRRRLENLLSGESSGQNPFEVVAAAAENEKREVVADWLAGHFANGTKGFDALLKHALKSVLEVFKI